jgi:hypothetical protein
LFKNFKKKGRTFNINNSVNYGATDNDQVNDEVSTFYTDNTTATYYRDQLRNRNQNNFNATLNANYNEPLNKAWSLRVGNATTYFSNDDAIATYTKDITGKYSTPNITLTNGLLRESWRNNLSTGLNWKHKAFNITGTANYLFLAINNAFQKTTSTVNQKYHYLLPGVNINWKELYFNYSVSVSPPGITDLQPVPDSTNSLFIQNGNPNLKPITSNSLNLNFFKNIAEKSLFISAYASGNFRNNAITRSRVVQANGVQISTPVNVDGVHDLYTNFNINKQYKLKKNFQYTLGAGYNISYNRNYLIVNGRKSFVTTTDIGPTANGSLNWMDKIEWNINYYMGFNRSKYESEAFTDLKVDRRSLRTELVLRWPKHIVWESSLNYTHNPVTAPGVQQNIALLNGGVTLVFLKDDKGQLKLSGFDLLDQNVSVYRYNTENQIIDRQTNILQRYFLATFTYNIRSFKGGKVVGSERFFRF